jgi:hypothetical protein
MDITIPSGSSAGTYTVNITNAGQTKVKAWYERIKNKRKSCN